MVIGEAYMVLDDAAGSPATTGGIAV